MSLLDDHYSDVREQRGYDAVDGAIGGLSAAYCRQRFAFTSSADALAGATPADTLVSVGISPTGPPHVGTLCQIQSALDFRRAGFDVQVVLADQVVNTVHGTPLSAVTALAERYAAFVRERGFDPDRGRLLIQSRTPAILATAFRLAPAYDPDDGGDGDHEPTAFEEALDAAYDEITLPDGATEFSRQLAGLLLAADAIAPLRGACDGDATRDGGYDQVVLVLGADNAGFERRIDDLRADAGVEGSVHGLYTRLVAGVDGTPKMSKSIPGSSIHLAMPPDRVRDLVLDPALDAAAPAESTVSQMLRHASLHDGADVAALREACTDGDERWTEAVREYADYLAAAARVWQGTA
jgi:tryptophanyl-tRNA synthetase